MPVVKLKDKTQHFQFDEAIKMLRTNVEFAGENVQAVCITSCLPNEGKSSIVARLAESMAQAIADAVRASSAEYITKIMAIQAVNTVEEADLPVSPSSPSVRRDTFLGAVLGAMLAVILIVIRFMLNDTIKDSEDVERYLGLSVLGVIPKEDDAMETSRSRKSRKRKAKRK